MGQRSDRFLQHPAMRCCLYSCLSVLKESTRFFPQSRTLWTEFYAKTPDSAGLAKVLQEFDVERHVPMCVVVSVQTVCINHSVVIFFPFFFNLKPTLNHSVVGANSSPVWLNVLHYVSNWLVPRPGKASESKPDGSHLQIMGTKSIKPVQP